MRTEATLAVDQLVQRLISNLERIVEVRQAQASLILDFESRGIPAVHGLTLPEWVQGQLGVHQDEAREIVALARSLEVRSTSNTVAFPSGS